MDMTKILPVDCISNIISLTSPKDACRSSSVSSIFKTAEDSDNVWESFLPADYENMISQYFISSLNKKQIFFHLCDHPILLNDGEMSLGIEKDSGKKCCTLSAKGLTIVWGDTKSYWQWLSLPESRFNEVAKLKYVWWLDIKGRVKANVLSPGTTYSAFFVYKLEGEHSMADRFVELSVNSEEGFSGSHRRVILDPSSTTNSMMRRKKERAGHKREDGWMEVEMGEFFNDNGFEGFTEFRLWETNGYIKDGLIVEGIEFRPKRCA